MTPTDKDNTDYYGGTNNSNLPNRTTTTLIEKINPFEINGGNLSFGNYNFAWSEELTTNTNITNYKFTQIPLNADYTISIYNDSAKDLTFTGTAQSVDGAVRIGGDYNTINTFTIPSKRYCICVLKYTNINKFNQYYMNFTLM
jgi:hypothetical protein